MSTFSGLTPFRPLQVNVGGDRTANPFFSPEDENSSESGDSSDSVPLAPAGSFKEPARAQLMSVRHRDPSNPPLPSPALNHRLSQDDPFQNPGLRPQDGSSYFRSYNAGGGDDNQADLLPSHIPYAPLFPNDSQASISTSILNRESWDLEAQRQTRSSGRHCRAERATDSPQVSYINVQKYSAWSRPLDCMKPVQQFLGRHIDPKNIMKMGDLRELVWPYTHRKYITLAAVAAAIGAIVVTQHYTSWIDKSMHVTREYHTWLLALMLAPEPILCMIALLQAPVPDLRPIPNRLPENEMNSVESHSTAVIIPCHNSDTKALKKVIDSAYRHVSPEDIYIVDNGRTWHPPSMAFRQFVRGENLDINYMWLPIGSKNAAQLAGSVAAKNNGYTYYMTMDDDVALPENYQAPIDLINDTTKGVAFFLRAVDPKGKTSLFLPALQDCEYKMSGLNKLAESSMCGVLFPHGAGWFGELTTLIELISDHHSLDFIAEDVNTGISMQKMKKRIAFDARIILETEVPTTIFGSGLNWWNQRYFSWETGRHGRTFAMLGRLLFSLNGQTTVKGIAWQKTILTYSVLSNVVDWVRVPVYATMGSSPDFWRQNLLLSLFASVPILAFKYIKARKRPDLQPRLAAAVVYPLYKQLYALVSVFGAIRSVLYYAGGHYRPPNVRQMIDSNDERVIWKDPRFASNPAFLADEAEALALAQSSSVDYVTPASASVSQLNSCVIEMEE